jgi:hypothetical protein
MSSWIRGSAAVRRGRRGSARLRGWRGSVERGFHGASLAGRAGVSGKPLVELCAFFGNMRIGCG